jgi:hypothetical protein
MVVSFAQRQCGCPGLTGFVIRVFVVRGETTTLFVICGDPEHRPTTKRSDSSKKATGNKMQRRPFCCRMFFAG